MVLLMNFPYNSAMFGLVSYNDHCQRSQPRSPKIPPQKIPEIFRTESESFFEENRSKVDCFLPIPSMGRAYLPT